MAQFYCRLCVFLPVYRWTQTAAVGVNAAMPRRIAMRPMPATWRSLPNNSKSCDALGLESKQQQAASYPPRPAWLARMCRFLCQNGFGIKIRHCFGISLRSKYGDTFFFSFLAVASDTILQRYRDRLASIDFFTEKKTESSSWNLRYRHFKTWQSARAEIFSRLARKWLQKDISARQNDVHRIEKTDRRTTFAHG